MYFGAEQWIISLSTAAAQMLLPIRASEGAIFYFLHGLQFGQTPPHSHL